MNSQHRYLSSITRILFDIAAIAVAWRLTIEARVLMNPWASRWVGWNETSAWVPSLLITLALWVALCWRLSLFGPIPANSIRSAFVRAAEGAFAATAMIVLVTFFSRELGAGLSRSFFLIFGLAVFASLSVVRSACALVLPRLERLWLCPSRVAILGDGIQAERLFDSMGSAFAKGAVRGLIVPEGQIIDPDAISLTLLGSTEQLGEVINQEQLNRIILLSGSLSREEHDACTKVMRRMSVIVSCTVDLAGEPGSVDVVQHYGLTLVETRCWTLSKSHEVLKRIFDVAVSAAALIILSPLMLLSAVLVKPTSHGPILHNPEGR